MNTVPALALLALDTATEACSAAVVARDAVLAHRFERLQRGHAERLMPMVEAVMAEAGLDYHVLCAMAATVGPGSFTGVRVGLAVARGLALAAAVPLIGVTTLEALAAAVSPAEAAGQRILCALDAMRGQVYAQWFDAAGVALTQPMATTAEAAAKALGTSQGLVVGSGADAVFRALGAASPGLRRSRAPEWPDAATVGRLVWLRAERTGGIERLATASVPPLYLREAGARPIDAVAPADRLP